MIRFSIRHPVTILMASIAAVLFGLVSLGRLSVNLLPEISYPTLTIQTAYPDAAPAEIEAFITEPLEEAVSVVQGLRSMHSISQSGVSQIVLEFAWGTNMDYASLDVREKVEVIRLPDDAKPPILLRFDPSLDPVLRIAAYGDSNLVALRHWTEKILKKDLEALEGVASARVQGGLVEEIHVELDEGKMALLGVPISAVSTALTQNNINASGGRLRDRDSEYLVRTLNELSSVSDIENIILLDEGGRRVTLGDIALVVRGRQEREIISRVNNKECVQLSIYKEGDSNTVQVADRVHARLRELQGQIPPGVEIETLFDQSMFIGNAINEVRSNALIGAILAVIVLFLFLQDLRSTLIIALSIPVSIIATFILMRQMHVSLNIMSLGGLALGVGMLVDNSIVVLESIARHRGKSNSVQSAEKGASEVGRAVFASTLTTVSVFLPIIFVEGIAGQIFKDQALTVTFSLLISLLVAMTLIPMISSLRQKDWLRLVSAQNITEQDLATKTAEDSLTPDPIETISTESGALVPAPPESRLKAVLLFVPRVASRIARFALKILWRVSWVLRAPVWLVLNGFLWPVAVHPLLRLLSWLALSLVWLVRTGAQRSIGMFMRLCRATLFPSFDASFARIQESYTRLLDWALGHRSMVLTASVLALLGSLALIPMLGRELIPSFSQGEFTFTTQLPEGTPLFVNDSFITHIEQELIRDPRIETVFVDVGGTDRLGAAQGSKKPNLTHLNIILKDRTNSTAEQQVIADIRNKLENTKEDVSYEFSRPSFFSFKTPIEIELFGYELANLDLACKALVPRLQALPGLRDVRASLEVGSPEVRIAFNRSRIASMNLDIEQISKTLRHKIRGEAATRLREQDRQIDIRVRTARADRIDIDQVGNLIVAQTDGLPVMLASVADINVERGPSQIEHIDQQRAVVIRADLAGQDLGAASVDIQRVLRETALPGNVTATLAGQNDELRHSFKSLILAMLLAIFMVYIVMASQFESLLHPFVILGTVPLSLIGILLALVFTSTPISVVVFLGVIMLAGIVVNNSIVLVDYVNQLRARGRSKLQALREAAKVRLRPILMTTLTTVLGLFPMALGLGEGAEIRAPMAIAVIGGLIFSTMITLVVIPVVYSVLDREA